MPVFRYRVKPNLYRDSIALMQLTAALLTRRGVSQATVMMATPANCAIVSAWGMLLPPNLHPDDLLLAIEGDNDEVVNSALDWAEANLDHQPTATVRGANGVRTSQTLTESVRFVPEANLAIVSVPGDYAYAEALKALKAGLHVFVFSNGVTLADEARLKQFATKRGLLMMGAECGTAIIGGVPLGFANVVRRGNIGLVAASGSGLQEVTCLIHNWGGGISHAIGTGGRDLHDTVGAVTMLAGLRLLLNDPETKAIVLLSKPPSPAMTACVLEAAALSTKPIIVSFLGADPAPISAAGLTPAVTLEEAAQLALVSVGQPIPELLPLAAPKINPSRRFIRGLFAGGTLCTEAILILQDKLGPIIQPPISAPCPEAHTCLDLGLEEYTRGRPHPMIDASLRGEQLRKAARDPNTAVVLFDIILGHGASSDPVSPLVEAIVDVKTADGPVLIAHICGTEDDPQEMTEQITRLHEARVVVAPTNAAAARLAGEIIQQ